MNTFDLPCDNKKFTLRGSTKFLNFTLNGVISVCDLQFEDFTEEIHCWSFKCGNCKKDMSFTYTEEKDEENTTIPLRHVCQQRINDSDYNECITIANYNAYEEADGPLHEFNLLKENRDVCAKLFNEISAEPQ